MNAERVEWLGIMRHAQAYRAHLGPDESTGRTDGLSRTGVRQATAVADRVAETVLSRTKGYEDWTIEDIVLVHAPTEQSRETTAFVEDAINKRWVDLTRVAKSAPADATANVAGARSEHGHSDPVVQPTSLTRPVTVRVCESRQLDPTLQFAKQVSRNSGWDDDLVVHGGPQRMVILIGHDPQMTHRLQSALAFGRSRLTRRLAGRTSLERGEMAMVHRRGKWTELMWVISPDSSEVIVELQAKIRSKMETAKVLGAFLTALTFFAAKEISSAQPRLSWYPWVAGAGITLLSFATVAFVITMFLYDGLLMPVRYWAPMPSDEDWVAKRRWYRLVGTGQDPRRPPSSAATLLFHGMQRVWSALFVPAAIATALGTAATGIVLARPDDEWWFAVIGVPIVVAVVASLLSMVARPQLGTTD